MAQTSLYRRYRPETFDKLIGQSHIVRTLVNQIEAGNISHAYLFTGTRGTGKTTVARIFAKAINCEHPVHGSPCGKCSVCEELSNPSNLDIIEIDAASNNSVDEIRDLREKVKYPPVSAKYKVYIIDEVHMMTSGAFNALLKTLEEPPSHVVFILATTDVHKLPATILSRCMRFDFKLLGIEELVGNLKMIFDDIGKKYEEEALTLIATAGEGSVRDSLSIAEMCLAFSGKVLTYSDVLEVLGASDPNKIINLVDCLIKKDCGGALNIISELANFGKNILVLSKDIAAYIRNILFIKHCDNSAELLKLPIDIYNQLVGISKIADTQQLLFILDLFTGISAELRYSPQPRILIEAAVVKATTETGVSEILQRLRNLENRLSSNTVINSAEKKSPELGETTFDGVTLWAKCRQEIVNVDKNFALGFPMNNYKSAELSGDRLKVLFSKKSDAVLLLDKENMQTIENKLATVCGSNIKLHIVVSEENESEDTVISKLKEIFGSDIKITK